MQGFAQLAAAMKQRTSSREVSRQVSEQSPLEQQEITLKMNDSLLMGSVGEHFATATTKDVTMFTSVPETD